MNIGATTGVVLDPTYTGKAVRGLVSELNNNPSRFKGNKILFIHTGKRFLKSNIHNCKHVVSWKMDIIMYTIFSLSILWYNVLLLHVYKMVKLLSLSIPLSTFKIIHTYTYILSTVIFTPYLNWYLFSSLPENQTKASLLSPPMTVLKFPHYRHSGKTFSHNPNW